MFNSGECLTCPCKGVCILVLLTEVLCTCLLCLIVLFHGVSLSLSSAQQFYPFLKVRHHIFPLLLFSTQKYFVMIITFYIFPYFKDAERKKNTYKCVVFVYESSYLLFLFFFLVIPVYSSYRMMTFLTAVQLCSMHFLGAFIVKYISLYLYFIKKSLYLLWTLDGKN